MVFGEVKVLEEGEKKALPSIDGEDLLLPPNIDGEDCIGDVVLEEMRSEDRAEQCVGSFMGTLPICEFALPPDTPPFGPPFWAPFRRPHGTIETAANGTSQQGVLTSPCSVTLRTPSTPDSRDFRWGGHVSSSGSSGTAENAEADLDWTPFSGS